MAAPPDDTSARPPGVSILLPIRDAAETLYDCLDSISAQSFRDFEVLCVDDGSRDESAAMVRRYAAGDRRFRLLVTGGSGLVGALNLGLEAARGALVARMDADDLMTADRLERQAGHLGRSPEVALVGSRVELFPAEAVQAGYQEYVRWQNECLTPEQIADRRYVESPLAHPSVMFRRGAVLDVGGYREGPFPEDYELWLRMLRAGLRLEKLPQVLLQWRESEDRTSRVDPRYTREAFDRVRAQYLSDDPRLQSERPFVVWGAGRVTRRRVRHLLRAGHRPTAWIDIDPRKIGRRLQGLPVHPPEWLRREDRPLVLIYVTNHGARELISGQLAGWGYVEGRDFLAVG